MSTDTHTRPELRSCLDLADVPDATRRAAALAVCDRAADREQAREVLTALGLLEAQRGPHVGALGANGKPTTTAGRAAAIELRRRAKQTQDYDIRRLLGDGLTPADVVDRLGVPISIVRAAARTSAP